MIWGMFLIYEYAYRVRSTVMNCPIIDIIGNKLMIGKTASKSIDISRIDWNDFTDEESSDEEKKQQPQRQVVPNHNHKQRHKKEQKQQYKYIPTRQQIDNQMGKLKQLDYNKIDEVWLEITSQDERYLFEEVDYLKGIARKNTNIVSVQSSKSQKNAYDILVYIVYAYDIIEEGYDKFNRMKVIVSERNFEKRGSDRGFNRRQKDYKQKGAFEKQGEKKRYVDKQTGREPLGKKQYEEKGKILEANQRIYSKEEAGRKREDLGGFRKKADKRQEETQQGIEVVDQLKVSKKTSAETEVKQEQKIGEEAVRQQKVKQVVKDKKGKVEEKKVKKSKVSKVKSLNPYEGIESLD